MWEKWRLSEGTSWILSYKYKKSEERIFFSSLAFRNPLWKIKIQNWRCTKSNTLRYLHYWMHYPPPPFIIFFYMYDTEAILVYASGISLRTQSNFTSITLIAALDIGQWSSKELVTGDRKGSSLSWKQDCPAILLSAFSHVSKIRFLHVILSSYPLLYHSGRIQTALQLLEVTCLFCSTPS